MVKEFVKASVTQAFMLPNRRARIDCMSARPQLDLLQDSRTTARWALDEVQSFKMECERFLALRPYRRTRRWPDKANTLILGIADFQEIPESIRRSAYRIITDFRHALDQATYAASIAVGTRKPRKTMFPSGDNFAALQSSLRTGQSRGIPDSLQKTFEELRCHWSRPDESGNDILRTLISLANPNKHEIPLTPGILGGAVAVNHVNGCDMMTTRGLIVDGKIEYATISITDLKKFRLEIEPGFSFVIALDPLPSMIAKLYFDRIGKEVLNVIDAIDQKLTELMSNPR